MTPSFADYARPRRRKNGTCAACGGPGEGRVAVSLQQRKANPGKTKADANYYAYPAIDSTSRTFCEACAIRIYEAAKVPLLGEDAA